MKKNIYPLEAGCFYHIYNRGINSQKLFFNDKNYHYFLNLMESKISSVVTVYAYCLMQNHFHILVRTKSEMEIRKFFPEKDKTEISKIISQQFSNMFNSYTQAINKHYGRTGKLFELPFRRKFISSHTQLINTIHYIHNNPVKHRIILNAENYRHSSLCKIKNGIDDSLLPVEAIRKLLGW
ncbi:REP element-mobilizing transposase RayT [Chryseobacterium taichungense]|uniref:REP element-mobilizing transposase RayT n=1 Tax=Chryseobacterium taichungense TaxID=295069 RepID=A0A1H7W5A0_9FLAO|nr:transposase [Chryseobacterium taichungense]SEM16762.1 REP element-mobilizing transposase RayT [Chryseobacterium taichungense]